MDRQSRKENSREKLTRVRESCSAAIAIRDRHAIALFGTAWQQRFVTG
jgi:hypothetical protein